MFALAPRSRTYPVLLPDRPSAEREPARRRTRRRPLPTIVAVAVIAVLPASALRAPDRIERIARADLGMLTPRPQQVAALPITTPTRAIAGPSPSAWDRLAAWFIRSEAAAGEPSQ